MKVCAFIPLPAVHFVNYLCTVSSVFPNNCVSTLPLASCIFEQFPICISSLYYEEQILCFGCFIILSLCVQFPSDRALGYFIRHCSDEIQWNRNNGPRFLILFFVASLFCCMQCILRARSPICRIDC